MTYENRIQALLSADATIKSLVKTFIKSTSTKYMIFKGALIPEKVSTDSGDYYPTVEDSTINHYRASGYDGSKPVALVDHIISCRAYTQTAAENMQTAVFSLLNRVRTTDGLSFFVGSCSPVVPPADKEDNYNARVVLSVRSSLN